ncbi:hypothetical protein C8R47DRAFT_128405 [Mycena vitilis]|nr:hypothetical protein C8R47DRAFT_128405 [Mycena vitilis]
MIQKSTSRRSSVCFFLGIAILYLLLQSSRPHSLDFRSGISFELSGGRVVALDRVFVNGRDVVVEIRPTQPHCSSAALIGLAIRVRLIRSLPPRFHVRFTVMEGSYTSPDALCKQLNDKERVAAACESPALMQTLKTMIKDAGARGTPRMR